MQKSNLIWIKDGRAYYSDISGERAARALRYLQEELPVIEVKNFEIKMIEGSEECFIVDDQLISLKKIEEITIGNVRLWSKKVKLFLE